MRTGTVLGTILVTAVTAFLVVPPVAAEIRSPGNFAMSIGAASETIPVSSSDLQSLEALYAKARGALDELPGGPDIRLYVRDDGHHPCDTGLACSAVGGGVLWLSPRAGGVQTREIVVHEYFHTRTNLSENIWLRFHPQVFATAQVDSDWTRSLEGAADCGVQLLVDGWAANGKLPYMKYQVCTPTQLAVAAAILNDTSLDDAVLVTP